MTTAKHPGRTAGQYEIQGYQQTQPRLGPGRQQRRRPTGRRRMRVDGRGVRLSRATAEAGRVQGRGPGSGAGIRRPPAGTRSAAGGRQQQAGDGPLPGLALAQRHQVAVDRQRAASRPARPAAGRSGTPAPGCSRLRAAEPAAQCTPAQRFSPATRASCRASCCDAECGRGAVQPGQRHLVAVDGFQLGPDGGRQRAGQGSAPAAAPASAPDAAPPGRTTPRRPAWAAGHGAGQLRRRGTGSGSRRRPAPRRPRRGRTPAAAARSRRRPAAGPCRRRPGSVGEALRGRWPPVRSPARRPSRAGSGSGAAADGAGGRGSGLTGERRRRSGKPGRPARQPAGPGPGLSANHSPCHGGLPSPGRSAACQFARRRPAAAGFQPARRPAPVRKTAVRRAPGAPRDSAPCPGSPPRGRGRPEARYRGMSSRRRFSLVSSFTTDHVVMPAGNSGAPRRPENG